MSDPLHGTTQSTNEGSTGRLSWSALVSPRVVRGFCALAIAMVVGDLVTTVYGLQIGLQEQNPFVLAVMTRYGVLGLVGLKVVAVGWVAVIWGALGRHYGLAAMAGLFVPQTAAVVLNLATILTA